MRVSLPWLLVILIMLLIFCLSSIPNLTVFNDKLPAELLSYIRKLSWHYGNAGFFSYSISIHPDYILHKIGHFVLFGLLGLSLYVATHRSVRWVMLVTILFAISDELHQSFIPGRSSRLGDIVLDTLSAFLFIYLAQRYEGNCQIIEQLANKEKDGFSEARKEKPDNTR